MTAVVVQFPTHTCPVCDGKGKVCPRPLDGGETYPWAGQVHCPHCQRGLPIVRVGRWAR